MKAHFDHTELTVQTKITALSNRDGPLDHGTGQYFFINVPAISLIEWHPFSVASSPLDDTSCFHMKIMPGCAKDAFTVRTPPPRSHMSALYSWYVCGWVCVWSS